MEYAIEGYSQIVLCKESNKEPVLFLPQAHLTHIKSSSNFNTADGGQQNLDLLAWNSSNDTKFVINTPLLSMQLLEIMTGSKIQIGNEKIKEVELLETNEAEVTLNYTPVEDNIKVYGMLNNGKQINSLINVVSIDGNVLTLDESGYDWVLVIYNTFADIEKTLIGQFKNQGYYSLIGKVEIYSKDSGEKENLYFEFPKIAINHSFDVQLLNNRSPSQVFKVECQAIAKSDDKSLLRIIKRVEG